MSAILFSGLGVYCFVAFLWWISGLIISGGLVNNVCLLAEVIFCFWGVITDIFVFLMFMYQQMPNQIPHLCPPHFPWPTKQNWWTSILVGGGCDVGRSSLQRATIQECLTVAVECKHSRKQKNPTQPRDKTCSLYCKYGIYLPMHAKFVCLWCTSPSTNHNRKRARREGTENLPDLLNLVWLCGERCRPSL